MSLKDLDDPDIVKLNVVLHTNKDTNSKISLTAKLFTFDKSQTLTGEYPFLCTNVEYNADYFTDKPTFEKVQIFFNRKEFDRLVALSGAPLKDHKIKEGDLVEVTKITEGNVNRPGKVARNNGDDTYSIEYSDGKYDAKVQKDNIRLIDSHGNANDIVRNNILLMLNIMFPISFPVNDNVSSLLNRSKQFDFMSLFKTIVSSGEYAYLNIDKPSTVIQMVWLDTITSNPVYVELYEAFKNYKKKLSEYALVKIKRADPSNIISIQKELTKFYKDYIYTYKSTEKRKHKKEYEAFDRLFKESTRVKNLNEQIELLKKMTKQFVVYDQQNKLTELDEIAKKLNVDEDADKKKLEKLINQYKAGTLDENEFKKELEEYQNRSSSTWWKMYFMLSRFKKNTSDYNEFIEKYVNRFVISNDNEMQYWAYNNSRSAIEAKFLKSTSDLEFYFNFLKKIEQFIPSYRKSLSMDISPLLGDEDNRYAINIDDYLRLYKDKKKNADASIDVIRPSKKTRSENEVDDTKNDYYEIHVGVAIVGGKIDASTDVWCYYNSIKLANDFSTIYDSIKLESIKQEAIDTLSLYPYVDLETKIAEAKGQMSQSKKSPVPKKPPIQRQMPPVQRQMPPVQRQMPPIQTKKKGGSKKGARKTLRLKK